MSIEIMPSRARIQAVVREDKAGMYVTGDTDVRYRTRGDSFKAPYVGARIVGDKVTVSPHLERKYALVFSASGAVEVWYECSV